MGEDTICRIKKRLAEKKYLSKEEEKDLEENVLPRLAEPVIKEIVDLLAERNYEEIAKIAELETWTIENLTQAADGFLALNNLPCFDKYGTPCNFNPSYEYHQLHCILFRDGSGFCADYDLTTNEELNDLTLQMEFLFTQENTMRAIFLDLHVM